LGANHLPMKILVFVETFMGPTVSFILNELNGLSEFHEVKVITTKRLNATEFPFPDVEEIPFTINRVQKKVRWLLEIWDVAILRKNKSFSKRLNEVVRDFNPDIIQGHFGYESLIMLENMEPIKAPVFITFHGYDASQLLFRKSYVAKLNSCFSNFDVWPIFVSNYMKLEMAKAGLVNTKGKVNYCGIDHNRFVNDGTKLPHDKFVFLQIASFNEKKGQIYTLRAFKKFLEKRPDADRYKLILAGSWGLVEEIKKAAKELGLNEHVAFPGPLDYDKVIEYLCKSNVFVHHSIVSSRGDKEGIPTAIMEAMAMELPILSTFHSGIPELVEDGVNGYLVDEKDVDAYAQRMEDSLKWGLIKVNREKVINHFSLKGHVSALIDMYEEAIKTQRQSK